MTRVTWLRSSVTALSVAVAVHAQVVNNNGGIDPASLPAQYVVSIEAILERAALIQHTQYVNPAAYAVMGASASRKDEFASNFNPTNSTPPFFQIFDESFLNILGKNASIRAISSNATFAFAHEGPIWSPGTDEMFFASNGGGPLGMSDIDHNNQVSKISLKEVEQAIAASGSSGDVNVNITKVSLLPMHAIKANP